MSDFALRSSETFQARRSAGLQWIAVSLVVIATVLFSISNLLWTVREGIEPLSANSEFFAYSWIYAIRWGAGEQHVFMPHSHLIFPVYAAINNLFAMTSGGTAHVLAGWHRISTIWPVVLTLASVALIFGTMDRRAPVGDALISGTLYLVAVPLFLSDHALNSLSYHSLAIPLALGALPLWRTYDDHEQPQWRFYILLGIYTAACALGKPTFLAFAVPLYAMEVVRAVRTRRVGGILLAGILSVAIYVLWMLAFCGGLEGLTYQISKTYEYMTSQSGMYDAAKGATPFHWYASYVVGVMGPLPSLMIAAIAGLVWLCRDRTMIIAGSCAGVASAIFCLYARSQLHAQPEFIALLLTLVVGAMRLANIPEIVERRAAGFIPPVAAIAALSLVVGTITSPPEMKMKGFAEFMGQFDAVTVPNLFDQPQSVRTIALQIYPIVFYGVGDAWCRGSMDIVDDVHSPLFDRAFGNMTCMDRIENPSVDISSYNRAMFPKEAKTSLEVATTAIAKQFPHVAARFDGCRQINANIPTFDLVECKLR